MLESVIYEVLKTHAKFNAVLFYSDVWREFRLVT